MLGLLQRLLTLSSAGIMELVNKSWANREQGLGVARLRDAGKRERGRDGWGQPGQAGERPRAEHLSFIVHSTVCPSCTQYTHQHVYLLCAVGSQVKAVTSGG